MPIPKKKQREEQKDFMMRCVPELMKYHNKDQAIAMCYDAFKGSVELESYPGALPKSCALSVPGKFTLSFLISLLFKLMFGLEDSISVNLN